MRRYLYLCFCLLFSITTQAQTDYISIKDAPQKVTDAYKDAYRTLTQKGKTAGLKAFQKLIKKYPNFVNSYLVVAEVHFRDQEEELGIPYLEKVIEIAPDYEPRVYTTLGLLALDAGEYADAEKHFSKFLTFDKAPEELTQKVEKWLGDAQFRPKALANPVPFDPVNLGSNVNSDQLEYFPSITADENVLVYTVQPINPAPGKLRQEDLYMSTRDKNGVWQPRKLLPNVNTDENEGAQSISADGKFLVFTACNRPQDFGSCDLYFSEKRKGKWTEPRNIGPAINTGAWESQPSVAPNGDAIYFVRGSRGSKDIWVSHRAADGSWQKPIPLDDINTPFEEEAPCIHPDGQTLYFSSTGYPGMGQSDLYMSKKQADGSWSTPVNLGYPINTPQQEQAIAVGLSGALAYISTDRNGGLGVLDIYEFTLPNKIRPNPVTYAKIRVLDANTRKPLVAGLEIVDLITEKGFLMASTDKDGEFLVCLPLGKDYALNVNKEKYIFHSEHFALEATHQHSQPLVLEILLRQIENKPSDPSEEPKESKPIILKNVFFATNSAKLKEVSKIELNRLKQLLIDNPKMHIQINGHTDSRGDDADNLTLSDNRAKAVYNYLIEQGIEAQRLSSKGYGENQPIDTNDTAEGRANNRRTEFVILK